LITNSLYLEIVHLTSTIIQILKNGIPPEINKYGKGKWTMENNVISFFSINKMIIDHTGL
jgi:hypothetical protein